MRTASYIFVGTEKAIQETFGSICRGVRRVASRSEAKRIIKFQDLNDQEIIAVAPNENTLLEQAPQSYKDVEQVIEVSHNSGISKKVVRLVPLMLLRDD
jgi:tRNA-splicing ligase RtcB